MMMICAFPVHRVDPENYVMYTHIMGIVRAVQDMEKVQQVWAEAYNARRGRNGLCTTYFAYLRLLSMDVEEDPFAWRSEGESIDIRRESRQKLGHILRERMRTMALRAAVQRRTHLRGAEGACADTMRKSVQKHKGILRSEILMLLCDGIWTHSKKQKAGLVHDSRCVWCGEHEDIHHILYTCRQWTKQRDAYRSEISLLLAGPPCRALCLIPDAAFTQTQKKAWPQLVEKVAALLHARLQHLPRQRHELQREVEREQEEAPNLPRRGNRWFCFSFKEGLRKGTQPWPYTVRTWNMINLWASKLRYQGEGEDGVYPTLLEAYVSFVLTMGGKRWETGQGAAQNGHWVSNQLVHFKIALKSFQCLASADLLLSSPPLRQQGGGWLTRLGFPRQECLCNLVYLPFWPRVRQLLREAPTQLFTLKLEKHSAERWRRWEVGEPGSQMYPAGGGGLDIVPLWRIPLDRLTQKQRAPPWWSQVAEAKRTLKRLESLALARQRWDGRPVYQWLEERGAVTYTTIQGVLSTLHADMKRAKVLEALEQQCRERKWHWPQMWAPKERPKCVLCAFVGYASQPLASMRRGCVGWFSMGIEDLTRAQRLKLAKDAELAAARAATLLAILKALQP